MPHSEEATFRNFDSAKANAYSAIRGSHPSALYDIIYDFHRAGSPPGQFGTCIDLGCGPGNSTKPLLEKFNRVVGVDPSEGMIAAARRALDDRKAEFVVGRAEDLGQVEEADMITAATAAHWFEMPAFWAAASRVVRPGGTVALWATCSSSLCCHPSDPRATQAQQILDRLEREDLGPFEAPGNRLCRDYYDDLVLPWQCEPPVAGFSKNAFLRKEWDRGGLSEGSDTFFMGALNVPLELLGKRLSSASKVIRWREAHPDLANTERDVVHMALRRLKEVLGRDEIDIGAGCVLLLFKKV